MVAVAGTPATFKILLAPAAVLSGIGTLMTPELTVSVPGTGGALEPTDNCVPLIPATPPQTWPTGVIATTGNGLTVNTAAFETFNAGEPGAHTPLNMQR